MEIGIPVVEKDRHGDSFGSRLREVIYDVTGMFGISNDVTGLSGMSHDVTEMPEMSHDVTEIPAMSSNIREECYITVTTSWQVCQ